MQNIITTTAPSLDFSSEQIDLIKRQVAKGTTDDQLKLFLHTCKRTGLDPMARQIYCVVRDTKNGPMMTIQTSIDGFRLIAERTGKYAGQVGPLWCGEDGEWKDVWLSSKAPVACKVGVLRSDFKEPVWGVARFEAFCQKFKDGNLMGLWAKMPDTMIAKCAESQALRKACPQELSGIYTSDEMEQADTQVEPINPVPARANPIDKLLARFLEMGLTENDLKKYTKKDTLIYDDLLKIGMAIKTNELNVQTIKGYSGVDFFEEPDFDITQDDSEAMKARKEAPVKKEIKNAAPNATQRPPSWLQEVADRVIPGHTIPEKM